MADPARQLRSLTPDALRARFGPDTYARGDAYARAGRVRATDLDANGVRLAGTVRGGRAATYDTVINLVTGTAPTVTECRCSCEVGRDCKHAVAVILHAIRAGTATPVPPSHFTDRPGPLTDEPSHSGPSPLGRQLSLGLQLSLGVRRDRVDATGDTIRLLARPARINPAGAFVTTGISWDRMPYAADEVLMEQLAVLEEIYSLHLVRSKSGRSSYSYDRITTLDLGELPGAAVWDLLASADHVGLELFHPDRSVGSLGRVQRAEFDVDVDTADSGDLTVRGRTIVNGRVLGRGEFAVIGDDAAGVVFWDPAAHDEMAKRRFQLARLDRPVPPMLLAAVGSGDSVTVAREDRAAFSARLLPPSPPSTRREPSVSVGPILAVAVDYRPGPSVQVWAQWRYISDGVPLYFTCEDPGGNDARRNRTAEYALLTEVASILDVPSLGGTLRAFERTSVAAARIVTDAVPALESIAGVSVTVTGAPPDFADVSAEVAIALRTTGIEGSTDWFDLGIDVTIGDTSVPIADVLAALTAGNQHLMLEDGRYFDLTTEHLTHLRSLVEEARSLMVGPSTSLRISRFHSSLWEDLTSLGVVTSQAAAWQEQVGGALNADRPATVPAPAGLTATLRSYQKEGLAWLSFIHRHGLGGILADDMGLGKTVQTLALIARQREEATGTAPFLIVAPTSVVHNWAREAAAFTPNLSVVTLAETRARRGRSALDLAWGADIVVTSYTIFRLDFDDFDETVWGGLILDEAQYVKNHQGKSYQSARMLEAPFKLAITGTPMENNVMELWALLSITSPGLFPSPAGFVESYRRPIERDGDAEALARLRRRIGPLVLRRTKELVAADLPPKQEMTVEIDLHEEHRRLYDVTFTRERTKVLGLLDNLDRNRVSILSSLTLLRRLALDPALLDDRYAHLSSAKTDELVDQLHEVIGGGHRALVFSQFTGYLARVREALTNAGIAHEYLDGSTRGRAAVVQRFRDGSAPVFLISLKAGGVGLTLTEADYCFVLDPWWNPATEAQAVDRAHRIGQTRTVFINRYVARGTIEAKVVALKERKAELFRSVMDSGGGFGGAIGADDIRGLLES